MALKNRQSTAVVLLNEVQLATGAQLLDQTVRIRFHERRLDVRRPMIGPVRQQIHRNCRQDFADEADSSITRIETSLFLSSYEFHL